MEQNIIVINDPKTFDFDFDLPKDFDENLKHETEFIIKSNRPLAGNKIKNEIEQLLLKYKHGMNTENGKTNELHNFVLNFSHRLD